MYLRSSEQFIKVDFSHLLYDIDLSVCLSVFLHFMFFICQPEWQIYVYITSQLLILQPSAERPSILIPHSLSC